ncbi:MAG TPA: CHASE2 domain-containing protein [Steroidobacteraceae bacterium]|nr:CHASE2 domain-containing protein [Steroidobacteraceae bacterium]
MSMGGGVRPAVVGGSATRARLPRAALQSLLLASVALFFLNFNLLGTASPGKRFSQDLVYAWFGNERWLYPRVPAAAGPGAGPHVLVVMVDEPALALRGARWPVPVEFHAQFLAELEVLRPRAIMLDFLLIDPAPQPDVCELLTVGARLRAEGIPLYLAVTRPEDLAPMDAAACRDANGALIHGTQVFTPVSVQRQADGSDFVSRRYPFEQRAAADAAPGSGLASAAVRMYCDSERAPDACLARLTHVAAADAGFELAWSPEGDPFNQRWSHASCIETTSPLRAILNQPALPRESPCPPVATLFAGALLSPQVDPGLGASNESLFAIADGAFVFVGGNFRGSGDLVTTPLHTLLPGVYYHAVALENLLVFDGHPKVRKEFRTPKLAFVGYDLLVLWVLAAIFLWRQRWLQRAQLHRNPFELSDAARGWIAPLIARYPTPLWILGTAALLLLLAAFRSLQLLAVAAAIAGLVIVELRVAPAAEIRGRVRGLLMYVAALALSLAVIVVATGVGYRWLRLPPGDWLGYFSFAAFGFFVAHTAILEFGRRVEDLNLARRGGGESQ